MDDDDDVIDEGANTSGSDDLDGGADDDTLYGDIGTSAGNDGDDTLRGGPGDDYIVPARGNDVVDGGTGTDTLSFGYLTAGVTFDLAINTAQDTGGGGTDAVTGIENVSGSEFSDVLRGDDGPNRLSGNRSFSSTPPANVDLLEGRGGNDSLSLSGNQAGSSAFGGPGNDTIFGDDGDDIIYGGSGNDNLIGGAGIDQADATQMPADDLLGRVRGALPDLGAVEFIETVPVLFANGFEPAHAIDILLDLIGDEIGKRLHHLQVAIVQRCIGQEAEAAEGAVNPAITQADRNAQVRANRH